jgi:Na+/H+ antiporter NhaC
MTSDSPYPEPRLSYWGGSAGALAPLGLFLAGVSWLGLSGAPDESGFWPVLLMALALGVLLVRDREAYAEAVVDGMSRRLVMIMVLAWLLAGVLGTLLRESGMVEALVWAAGAAGVSGGGYVAAAFLVAAVFSTATGTSLGTLLICVPLLYPAGSSLGADPAFLLGAILGGATFGDNVSPISDTTIASAGTQGADIAGVVRSRVRYALPAALVSLTAALWLGGGPPAEVSMESLVFGILLAAVLGLVLGAFQPGDLVGIDRDNFMATGLLLEGMRRAVGISVFTLLLMGLVGAIEASGLMDGLVSAARSRLRSARGAEGWIFATVTAAVILTTHSVVAILAMGGLAKEAGESFGLGPYRRANILDVTVCTWPFLLPFFIPTILASALTGGLEGVPRLSPWSAGLHNVHSWALLGVIVLAIASGWGRQDRAVR